MKLLLLLKPLITKVKEIAEKLGLIADYVVEEGTSGIWTYRKWNSGIAECWANKDFSVNIATAYGSVYFARLWDSLPLPSGLFITAPTSAIEIFDSYADCWLTKRFITSEEIGVASLLCPTTGSRHGVASISCKGRWK